MKNQWYRTLYCNENVTRNVTNLYQVLNAHYNKLKISTFLIGLIIIIFSETTIRFISNDIIPNFQITVIPLCLFLILYFTFLYKFKFFKKNKL